MKRLLTLPLIAIVLPMVAPAAPRCEIDKLTPFTWGNEIKDNYVHVDADYAKMTPQKVTLKGDVIAKRGQEVLYADEVQYNRIEEFVASSKTATYGRPDFALRSQTTDYSFKEGAGQFQDAEYYLSKYKAVGTAKTLTVDRKADTEKLTEATYTTCPRLKSDWFIKAKKIELDHNTDMGKAWNTTFHIGKVPVMYLPYFTFPLTNKRKTGFLMPSVDTSEGRGFELTVPFYINIAPNHDATITPRIMSKRGVMIGTEYRYLMPEISGIIAGTYLSKDRKTKKTRWSFKTAHTYQPNDKLVITGLYQRVSDKYYIEDFVDTLDLTSDSFLPSYLKAGYRLTPNYRVSAEVKEYQVAKGKYTKNNKPYALLPQIKGQGTWSLGKGFSFSSDTELTTFEKETAVSGTRINQELALSYLFQNAYSFIKPKATYRYTTYSLERQNTGVPKNLSRAIPTFSLDSGLTFERQGTWFGKNATQILEPRLFYLYTPYKDQSQIPNFDSGLAGLSYSSLFLENRFNGKDRVGDAHQLTTAVSTTFTDNDTGQELAKLSVGQIQYFRDRRVSLNNRISEEPRSNVVAEGRAKIGKHFKIRGLLHRDIDNDNTEKSLVGLSYHPDTDKAISVSHLYDRDSYKQVDIAGVWRWHDNWRSFWRWNYSVKYDKAIDIIAGIEYADCCWGVRVMARRQRDDLTTEEDPEDSIYVEFVLNGLGSLGNDTSRMLKSVIPYYRPINYERN